jgi:hypothetical protein
MRHFLYRVWYKFHFFFYKRGFERIAKLIYKAPF